MDRSILIDPFLYHIIPESEFRLALSLYNLNEIIPGKGCGCYELDIKDQSECFKVWIDPFIEQFREKDRSFNIN